MKYGSVGLLKYCTVIFLIYDIGNMRLALWIGVMLMRQLGRTSLRVNPPGLGCMGMSFGYSESTRDDAQLIRVLQKAIEIGINFFDTANVYGDGHNERLIGKALEGYRSEIILATKLGLVVDDIKTRAMHIDGSARNVYDSIDAHP